MKVCMNIYLCIESTSRTSIEDNEHEYFTGATHAINHISKMCLVGILWAYYRDLIETRDICSI